MYYVLTEGHSFSYEIYEILTIYFPSEKITVLENENYPEDGSLIKSSIKVEGHSIACSCWVGEIREGKTAKMGEVTCSFEYGDNLKRDMKHAVKVTLFDVLREITGSVMPWGILVGIRPSKIVNDLKNKGYDGKEIKKTLKDMYRLREDKIKLVTQVSDKSYPIINNDKKRISIYIGIPFCPTRCIYCSFASYPLGRFEKYVEGYLSALKYEIESLSTFVKDNFTVDTIYVGGGTPTSIGNNDFAFLMNVISDNFDIDCVNEFTVEAGRPDTINEFKLKAMIDAGVGRISINPQTMNEDTLKRVGRNHSVQDVVDKFNLARDLSFTNINMDIILGLPGEGIEHVKYTVEKLISLSPENITVHSMAVKRASKLKESIIENGNIPMIDMNIAGSMMDYAQEKLDRAGYYPYYMYRQKQMVGNLENVGYCKKNYECIYNIQMIEEKETILGFGADSVTKAVFLDENRIERLSNKKDIEEYISTIKAAAEKKREFLKLLT